MTLSRLGVASASSPRTRIAPARLGRTGLAIVFAATTPWACLLDAGLDQGACYSGRVRVDGVCEDGPPSIVPAQKLKVRAAPSIASGIGCKLKVQTRTLDFGYVPLGEDVDAVVMVSNQGHLACAMGAALMSVDSQPEFTIVSGESSAPIPPQGNAGVRVRYSPRAAGMHQGRLLLHGPEGPLGWTQLTGQGVRPGNTLELQPSAVEFGRRGVDCTAASTRPVYLRNPTDRPLRVTWSEGTGAFVISGGGVEHEIAPGRTATVSVTFFPRVAVQHVGRLIVQLQGGLARSVFLFGTGAADSDNREVFAGGQDFYLQAQPVVDSVRVFIDDVEQPPRRSRRTVWTLDAVRRHLAFAAPVSPQHRVQIDYSQHCAPRSCGDGRLDVGEYCDDGNTNPHDACLNSCESSTCGDGVVRTGVETCDDGNTRGGDGCNWACQIEVCGNGVLEPPEQCDEGSANSDTRPDACRTTCRFASCYDGVVDDGEFCDDGNTNPNDECQRCRWAECGDGVVHFGVEECDDGNGLDFDSCRNDCRWPTFDVGIEGAPTPELAPDTPVVTSSVVRLPFDLHFLGETLTDLNISQPGLLGFGETTNLGPANGALPEVAPPNRFIALWWDDLQTTDPVLGHHAKVRQSLSGVAPDRVFALRFEELRFDGAPLTMHVEISEANNTIRVYYAELGFSPSAYAEASATVGWESGQGLRGFDALGCSPRCTLREWPGGHAIQYSP